MKKTKKIICGLVILFIILLISNNSYAKRPNDSYLGSDGIVELLRNTSAENIANHEKICEAYMQTLLFRIQYGKFNNLNQANEYVDAYNKLEKASGLGDGNAKISGWRDENSVTTYTIPGVGHDEGIKPLLYYAINGDLNALPVEKLENWASTLSMLEPKASQYPIVVDGFFIFGEGGTQINNTDYLEKYDLGSSEWDGWAYYSSVVDRIQSVNADKHVADEERNKESKGRDQILDYWNQKLKDADDATILSQGNKVLSAWKSTLESSLQFDEFPDSETIIKTKDIYKKICNALGVNPDEMALKRNDRKIGVWKPSTPNQEDIKPLTDIAGIILGMVKNIGTIIAVITLSIIGIRYMFGSIEEKAQYKETMWPYIIGAFMLACGTNLLSILYNFAIKM